MRILTVSEAALILRQKSRPVLKIDDGLLAFLKELGETLAGQKDPAGVGLSAIQVGRAIRVFAAFLPDSFLKSKSKITFYINPEIAEHAAEMTLGEELTENREHPPAGEAGRTENSNQKTEYRRQKPFLEGCLSVPRIYGAVMRWSWIRARTIIIDEDQLRLISNIRYQISNIRLDGLYSRIFQHELDHLNGILFTDQVLLQGNKLYREEGKEMVEMEM